MSEIYKLVQAIESYNESDLCLGTLRSLKKIKDAAAMLEAELIDKDRQLAEARAEIERLKRCCNCEYASHKLEICEHPDNEPETFMDGVCDLWSHNI